MNSFDLNNIFNLYSLYNKVGLGFSESNIITGSNFKILKTNNSAWPNLSFLDNIDYINDEILDQCTNEMIKINMKPIVFAGSAPNTVAILRKQGYMPIEQSIGMHYDLTGQKRISDQGISIVNTLAEISEWTDTVSKILFESKPLSMNLFKFLQNESADLLAIRIDQSIIGTSMIYYDEQGNAGIYMVAVDEKFRGMGFGKKIIRQCFELIIRRNISKCYLQATKMGFPLYKTLGFERTENYILYWKIK